MIEDVRIQRAVYVFNNPFIIDPVRTIITPESEVGTTLITVHVVQLEIGISKLLIPVPVTIKHSHDKILVVTKQIGTITTVQITIHFAGVFPKIPHTLVLDNFKIEHPITLITAKLLIRAQDHVQQEATTLNVTIGPDEKSSVMHVVNVDITLENAARTHRRRNNSDNRLVDHNPCIYFTYNL